jgi:hypothetical protein
MSSKTIVISRISAIVKHNNANKLEIAIIDGFQCVVPKNRFVVNQPVVYFPPEVVLIKEVAVALGVENYLNFSQQAHPVTKIVYEAGRTKTIKLRGEYSMGIVVEVPPGLKGFHVGYNCNEFYQAWEYEPILPSSPTLMKLSGKKLFSNAFKPLPHLPTYSDTQNLRTCPEYFEGQNVAVTEKIHGSNLGIGFIQDGNTNKAERILAITSRNYRRKIPATRYKTIERGFVKLRQSILNNYADLLYKVASKIKLCRYFPIVNQDFIKDFHDEFVLDYGPDYLKYFYSDRELVARDQFWFVESLLNLRLIRSKVKDNIVLYGEITGTQAGFTYGKNEPQFFAFSIKKNGLWLSYDEFISWCKEFSIPTAPLLYKGTYDFELIKKLAVGHTRLGSKHLLEGVVVESQENPGDRKKFVSLEYLAQRDEGKLPDSKDE